MATPTSSSLFSRLTTVFRFLSLRSDIDNIILELLGQFSLEKIYAEADKEVYQDLVITLLVQLNTIINVQRLTLPSENSQVGWYLGFLASWEVTLRAVEFVMQIVVEGRESLWEARLLREKYLAEVLLNALRFLTLHPKIPSSRAKDRRDRFARLHRQLERIFDSYSGQGTFLLLVCKEITDSLRSEPDGLALPPRLRLELPNLASELYPLPDCLSSQYVASLVPPDGTPSDWLVQFLALRDISQFVVGASVQYVMKRETRDMRLQSSSARTRNAVLHTLENLRMPGHLSKFDLVATFSEAFRIILPNTLDLGRRSSADSDELEIDAIDLLCSKLSDRQLLSRVSDHELNRSISEVTRNIALLDDPSGQFRSSRPRLWVLNCQKGHVVGETQLKAAENMNFPTDRGGTELITLPPQTECIQCGGKVTLARELSVVRYAWDHLKPFESNTDAINVERHLKSHFQLSSPRIDTSMPFHAGYGNVFSGERLGIYHPEPLYSPSSSRSVFPGSISFDQASPVPPSVVSPQTPYSPKFPHKSETPHIENLLEGFTSSDGLCIDTREKSDNPPRISPDAVETPNLPEYSRGNQSRLQSVSSVSLEPESLTKSRTAPPVAPPEKGKSRWRSKLTASRKESTKPTSGDSSSLSSTSLESQKLEEFSLARLASSSKSSSRGKSGKSINVYLSQNSTYALLWTQTVINIWDIGSSTLILGRAIATESNCVLAAVTKVHLAYIIGTRDQKLTLRIVNLIQANIPAIEYRMPSSPWCTSITICPKENQVVVGFDNSIVRFFKTTNSEEPREDRLHNRFHKDCKSCPAIDTLSFSRNGFVLLASTRMRGTIQVYSWRFPFVDFQEVAACRYYIPLHELEDNGTSSAIFRSGMGNEESLICITTWTQSGTPLLIQPHDGHRTEIRTEPSTHQGKLGSRIQGAAFSPTGRELAMVNDKGHVYIISNLNSNPLEVKRIATSKELTTKSDWFAMEFMSLPDEEAIVLAWADSAKGMGYVKKIPVKYSDVSDSLMGPLTPAASRSVQRYELPSEGREIPKQPVELTNNEVPAAPPPPDIVKSYSKGEDS
ncbi:hypothetical protein L207DRAFT_640540 [Hyaloscypha variabilis F]|uniref:WD40 repeat-like protein n=1 Tax=Hyaloscypha variabilis (strain UAMH 11265 / GT02V1 / F) TaxID=1149755 RepID=A0A2J6QZL7_HYAVF|nr:hypothetical protein L207DRAFT_640540 [Hyaloscypha variabilis F]